MRRSLTVSVISHGHASMVERLLGQMAQCCGQTVAKVIVTLNTDELLVLGSSPDWPFELELVQRERSLGFAENHNDAFGRCTTPHFCVLNPDVELSWGDPFGALMDQVDQPWAGIAYPIQMRDAEEELDSARELPTPWALLRRYVFPNAQCSTVEWVNGACMVFRYETYRRLGGFDSGYRLYCEDVDLCLRVRQLGLQLVAVPVKILHDARRASHRTAFHLLLHLKSLFRLWVSLVFWRAVCRR